jgi:hypothetical protein
MFDVRCRVNIDGVAPGFGILQVPFRCLRSTAIPFTHSECRIYFPGYRAVVVVLGAHERWLGVQASAGVFP